MREASVLSRLRVEIIILLLFSAAWSASAAQPSVVGPAGSLCDRPTSSASFPNRLEISYEWLVGDRDAKKFLVIVPPNRALEAKVIAATVEPTDSAADSSKTLVGDPAQWFNAHPSDRLRVFSTQPIGYVRHYKIVEIQVNPVFQAGNANYTIRRMRWVYRWKPEYRPEGGFRDEACRRTDQGFGAILPRLIVNPDALGLYADPTPPAGDMSSPLDGVTFGRLANGKRPVLRLSVDEKALYRLDLRPPTSATSATPLSPDHTHLYNSGRPVPLYVHLNPSQPGSSPELIFYGAPSESKHTRTNRYWQTEDEERKPARMAEAPVEQAWQSLPPEESFPEALVIEQDKELIIHGDQFLTISDFRWIWGEIPPADQPVSATAMIRRGPEGKAWFTTATFSLPGLAEPNGQTKFDVAFYYKLDDPMKTMEPMRVEARINNDPFRVFALQETELTHSFTMSNVELRETSNTIEVRFAGGQSPPNNTGYYFDRLVAHYRRRFEAPEHGFTFAGDPPTSVGWRHYVLRGNLPARPLVLDVADAAQPRVMLFERDEKGALHFGQKETRSSLYRVFSLDHLSTPTSERTADLADVSSQTTPIDYLIISHRDFLDLLDPLVATLRESGWRVRVVDVENVYASFSWGLSGPLAIKAFLAHTLQKWPGGGPTYVLLVGDCTTDYRDDFRNEVKNLVPTFLWDRGPREARWATEHWFTTICGADEYCDVILGRLSVNSRKDAKTVVDKIVRYRTHPVLDPWRMRLTYIADEGTFDADAERWRGLFRPPALVGQPIYLDDFPWEDNFYLPPEIVEADKAKVSPVCTTRILDMFNRGSLFVCFNGHGSPNIWSNDRIWFGGDSPNSDILLMRNGERLPFIVNLSCNTGAIDYPEPPWNLCISEDFMRSPTGGAIALFVPTAPNISSNHMRLTEELHDAFFFSGLRTFGDIVYLTKFRSLVRRHQLDMIKMYLLLGEPSCPAQLPDQTFPLAVDRTLISATTGGQVRVSGRSELGAGQKGMIALFSPREEERFSSPLEFAPDGRFERIIEFPKQPTVGAQHAAPDDETSTWTIRAYCWNEATHHDAVGWACIRVARPDLALTRFEREPVGATVHAGDPTTFACAVANRSSLAAEGVLVKVYRLTADRRFLLDQIKLMVGPGEERTVRLPWKAEAGFFRFEALLAGAPDTIGNPAPGDRRKTLDLAVVGSAKGSRVEISPAPIGIEIIRADSRHERQSAVLIGCVGAEPTSEALVTLTDESGSSETQNIGRMSLGEVRMLRFQRQMDKAVLPREYRVAVRYRDNAASKTALAERTERVQPTDFPDLTILGDRIMFRDEGNRIAFHDPTPTDGHTVYFDVPVKNIGGGPAGSFTVEAFEGLPSDGKPLRSLTEFSARKDVAFLDPGQEEIVRFRWDPIHNAGPCLISFRVDGDQRVTESSKSNNETSRTLKILSKGKLAAGQIDIKIPGFEQAQKGLRPLGLTIMNEGETTLTQVLAEIYIGSKQTPPNKIGEMLVEKVGPNSKVEPILEWKPTPEQIKRVAREKFTYIVRQKGSTRRVTNLPKD
jgi:hypothetical protein